MLKQLSRHFEVIGAWNIHDKAIDKWPVEVFAERSYGLSATRDFICRAESHEFPMDIDHFVASQTADDQPIMLSLCYN